MSQSVADSRAARTGEGYDPVHFARLAAIEERHFWFVARRRLIAGFARAIAASLSPGYRVLEVGCGTGSVLRALESACERGSVFGMDRYSECLPFAARSARSRLIQADAGWPPFSVGFDIVGAFDVIEHLADDDAFLANMKAMLRPGGWSMITVPAYKNLWSDFDDISHHYRRYETGELRNKLARAGFEHIFVSPFMMTITPIVWLHRRRYRASYSPQSTDAAKLVESETRIVPFLNGILRLVLSFESAWVRRKQRLPFGTSLIAIAQKPSKPTSDSGSDVS